MASYSHLDTDDKKFAQQLDPSSKSLFQVREYVIAGREATVSLREDAATLREDMHAAREAVTDELNLKLRVENQHLLAAARESNEQKDIAEMMLARQTDFMALLAHDLRNPLAPIRNAATVLGHENLLPADLENIRSVISRQVSYMARLLDDLLDASRVASGKLRLDRLPTSVREALGNCVEQCQPMIDAQGHFLEMELPQEEIHVDGDPHRLAQIFGNLLHNATKYTPPGGRIRIKAEVIEQDVVLRFIDNGVGISADLLPRIFERFWQETRSLGRSEGGLGLGLAIVQSMVELHGGDVQVFSAGIDQGSEFVVRLPRTEKTAPLAPARVDTVLSQLRILLIDDSEDACRMLVTLFEMAGHRVETAFNGASAMELFRQGQPDVVLCDIGLPGKSGYDIAREMRKGSSGNDMLMVALSGYAEGGRAEKALAAGFDFLVCKPAEFKELLTVIQEGLVSRRKA